MDWKVRCRLANINNIRFLQGCEVTELVSNTDSTCVTGVAVRHHQPHQGVCEEEQLHADLVIDATGRTSKAPQWLKAIGYQPPQETVVNPFLGYASRVYRLPFDFQADWKGVALQAAPPSRTRGAGLLPLEENRWILTVYGGDRDYPPTDEAGFLEFVRSLPYPAIYDAIKDAEPLSQIYSYRATENRWRHYERLPRYLEGFLVVGDAACAFNPVYGQGMTTAALGALTLDKCLQQQQQYQLDRGFRGLARRFQKKLAKINAVPWLLATSEDYRYPGAEGQPPSLLTRVMHRYMDGVLQLTTNKADVRLALLEVIHMLKPPTTLFQPRILIQVLRGLFKLSFFVSGKNFT
ncbi:MAG: 2-polyprenyl-6-methoxyphenol hydroxylase-like oxidoreductase [Microcoleus sp. SIO2G3]|nr:2-polyprenyl-6-methoxyphenol hydroxylase-like oxidoreductase [Microcoleus sp. SIO2G3]